MSRRRTTGAPARGRNSGVMLPAKQVDSLRAYLDRAADTTATAEERADARTKLCGYIGYVLDHPPLALDHGTDW